MPWLRRPTLLSSSAMSVAFLCAALSGCGTDDADNTPSETTTDDTDAPTPRGDQPAVQAGPATLRRLTTSQYRQTLRDLLGDAVALPTSLEPDLVSERLIGVGAAVMGLSARGVEQYEAAAYDLAHQALTNSEARPRVLPCTPSAAIDAECARTAIKDFGRRAWRRPLTTEELDQLTSIATESSSTLGSFDAGYEFALAALLQSPNFLYRVELGEPDPENPAITRYTDWEMASRLSYFLWNTTPDDELLTAAEAGRLTTDDGLAAEVDRMLDDPRARAGIRALFEDDLGLAELGRTTKDPNVYLGWSPELLPAAREETLRLIEHLVLDEDTDWRELLVSQSAFVDRRLAALYGIPAPSLDDFAEALLPESSGRRGLTGQATFLAMEAHPTTTSVTRRGKYVRERLLCQTMPSPPPGLNTAIPPATSNAPTMRDRVAVHLTDPSCAGCHNLMDPIGLAFENFDGIGGWRTQENGVAIDPSGQLDGVPFANAWELAGALHDHPRLSACLTRQMFAIGTGRLPAESEEALLDWHVLGFEAAGHRVRFLLRDLALGPGFRAFGPPTDISPDDDSADTDGAEEAG